MIEDMNTTNAIFARKFDLNKDKEVIEYTKNHWRS